MFTRSLDRADGAARGLACAAAFLVLSGFPDAAKAEFMYEYDRPEMQEKRAYFLLQVGHAGFQNDTAANYTRFEDDGARFAPKLVDEGNMTFSDSGIVGSIGVGWWMVDYARTEVTLNMARSSYTLEENDPEPASAGGMTVTNEADVDVLAGMISLWVEVNNLLGLPKGQVQPYFGGGLGVSMNSTSNITRTGSIGTGNDPGDSMGLAWAAGAGLGLQFTDNFALDLNVRYIDYGTFETMGKADNPRAPYDFPIEGDAAAVESKIGFRVHF